MATKGTKTMTNEKKVDARACPHGREVDEYCPECAPPAQPQKDARPLAFEG